MVRNLFRLYATGEYSMKQWICSPRSKNSCPRRVGHIQGRDGEIVPAIISEELWDKANEVLTRRSRDAEALLDSYLKGFAQLYLKMALWRSVWIGLRNSFVFLSCFIRILLDILPIV